jgi:hypothetical protein
VQVGFDGIAQGDSRPRVAYLAAWWAAELSFELRGEEYLSDFVAGGRTRKLPQERISFKLRDGGD